MPDTYRVRYERAAGLASSPEAMEDTKEILNERLDAEGQLVSTERLRVVQARRGAFGTVELQAELIKE